MENASKALLMAGEVLLGIIVVSLLMIMVNSLTSYQQVNTQTQREAQVVQFNNQFEGYDRERVRGNELYSLVNKVVDYNKRRSSLGTESDETGDEFRYQPMRLTIILGEEAIRKDLTRSNTNNLFKEDSYTFNKKTNIDNTKIDGTGPVSFRDKVEALFGKELPENNYYRSTNKHFYFTEDKLIRLLDSYEKIFIADFDKLDYSDIDQRRKKFEVFENFNNAFGEEYFVLYKNTTSKTRVDDSTLNTYWDYLSEDGDIWKTLNIYFEYSQFKRGIFKCAAEDGTSGIEYDHDTGRVIGMTFIFTGKFD